MTKIKAAANLITDALRGFTPGEALMILSSAKKNIKNPEAQQ